MHDTYNPWHGCTPVSAGCAHCYMISADKKRGLDGTRVHRNKTRIAKPTAKNRHGAYKVRPGEVLRVCMTSDFLHPDADPWRDEAWEQMRARPDVGFLILTKRPERFDECLPDDWGQGWDNVRLSVSVENQTAADARMPWLMETPAKHKGVMCAPLIGAVNLTRWLGRRHNPIEEVLCGGENHEGHRPCDVTWVRSLATQCRAADVTFTFFETGTTIVANDVAYTERDRTRQRIEAWRSDLSFVGSKPPTYGLCHQDGSAIADDERYHPLYRADCAMCARRVSCNGCSRGCRDCDGTPSEPTLDRDTVDAIEIQLRGGPVAHG